MRALVVALSLVAAVAMSGCGNSNYDPKLCDFYQSLGASYMATSGYVPSEVQDDTHKYCDH